MSKGGLIVGIAEESGISKADTEKVLNVFLSQVEKVLCAGDKVQLTGFGSFEVKKRAECIDRNPKANEPIMIPAGKMSVFKAGRVLKDAIK